METQKLNFWLTEKEYSQYIEWDNIHKKKCPLYGNDGAIGGRLEFCFRPTSLGIITIVKCECGEEIDLTDLEAW